MKRLLLLFGCHDCAGIAWFCLLLLEKICKAEGEMEMNTIKGMKKKEAVILFHKSLLIHLRGCFWRFISPFGNHLSHRRYSKYCYLLYISDLKHSYILG